MVDLVVAKRQPIVGVPDLNTDAQSVQAGRQQFPTVVVAIPIRPQFNMRVEGLFGAAA